MIYGSGGGLSATGNQSFTQDDVGETAADGNRFGAAVTVGDFNHDGFADLAVGAPGENPGSANDAGAVDVLYGSPNGLSASGDQVLSQGGGGIQGSPAAGDRFGAALAAADLNGDGRDDLAVGAPGDSVGSSAGAGAVNVIYGSGGGLTATGNQLWTQDSPGVLEAAEGGDSFGSAVSAADLNGDGRADLAVGVPGESIGTNTGRRRRRGPLRLRRWRHLYWQPAVEPEQHRHPRRGGGRRLVWSRARGGRSERRRPTGPRDRGTGGGHRNDAARRGRRQRDLRLGGWPHRDRQPALDAEQHGHQGCRRIRRRVRCGARDGGPQWRRR